MRFTYAESMCDPHHFFPLVRAAEAAGWDSFSIPDSICYPEVSDSKYPYTPDGNREFLDGKPFIERLTSLPKQGQQKRIHCADNYQKMEIFFE